jgi:hypothetical protein
MELETTCDIETGLRRSENPQVTGNKGGNGPREGDLETYKKNARVRAREGGHGPARACLPHLLRYGPLAVLIYSFASRALHLRQTEHVQYRGGLQGIREKRTNEQK